MTRIPARSPTFRSPLRSGRQRRPGRARHRRRDRIGRATALELARSGAGVVIAGRRPEPLEERAAEIEAIGAACLAVPADVREPDEVERVVDAALERFGRIDVLVNNAGGQFTAPAEEISDKGWRAVHRLSVDAAWSLTRRSPTRSMIPQRGGLVVFVGFSPRRGIPGYRARHRRPRRAREPRLRPRARVEPLRDPQRLRRARARSLTEGLEGYGADEVAAVGGARPARAPRHRRGGRRR